MTWITGAKGCATVAFLLANPLTERAMAESNLLPSREICPSEGSKQVWIEGLRTCVEAGGYLWAEGYYNTYSNYPAKDKEFYSIGTVAITANTTTEMPFLGPLRGVADVRFQYRTSDPWSDGPSEFQIKPQTLYLEWAGITFGVRNSFFDFYENEDVLGTDPGIVGDDTKLPVLGYTLALARDISLTLALEQGRYRDSGIKPADAASAVMLAQNDKAPDFVVALGQTTAWGSYQFSGALHRIALEGDLPQTASSPTSWGYAFQAGVMVNLPMLAKGDSLYLQTAYVDGATSYLGLIDPSGDFSPPDAYWDMNDGFSRVTGWNITAQYLHNWSPVLNSAFYAAYGRFDLNDANAVLSYGASGGQNFNAGGNLVWSATENLSFVAQYVFNYYAARDYVKTSYGLSQSSQSAHQILLMARYDF
ncbi:porin [Ancylobacter sp.]|uniref:porin n=1 Tax=Ancylobacter sp. TaxID=1872567 RepID=UPI003C7B921B